MPGAHVAPDAGTVADRSVVGANDVPARRGRGAQYEIVVRGRLSPVMRRWFEDLEEQPAGRDETHLVGWFEDQAALQGFLAEVSDLGLELSTVRRLPGG